MGHLQTHEATRDNAVAQVDAEKYVRDNASQGSGKSPRDLHGWKWALSYTAMLSTTFLFALDNTIVADIQPAIIHDLTQIELLPWVGTGFALGTMVVLPLSKAYGIFSIRSLYLANILLFEVGSALCGAAPNMNAMILGRVIAGVGGAGMYAGTLTYVAVCTSMEERAAYMAGSTVVWGIGTVLGPVVGGAFAESSATWRWGFYINLVVGALFCPAYLFLFPLIDPQPGKSLSDKLKMMDWPMTLTFLSGSTFLIMAISFGGTLYSWHSGAEIAFWTLSGTLLVIAAILLKFHPGVSKENQLWPAHFLQIPVVMNLQLQVFLSGGIILTITYYIPLYFQFIRGDGPLDAGVRLLPLVISMIVATIVSGLMLPKTPCFSPWYIGGSVLVLVGTALMYTIDENTNNANIYGYSIMIGFGAGCYVVIGFTILQSLVPVQEISNAVAVMTIAQNFGMVLFLSLCGTIFQNTAIAEVGKALPDLPKDQVSELIAGTSSHAFQSLSQREKSIVVTSITAAIRCVWLLFMVAAAVSFVFSLPLVVQDLQTRLERAEAQLGTRSQDATPLGADTGLPLLMPLPRTSTDSSVLPSEPKTAIIQQEVAYLGEGTTFGDVDLGFDQLLDLDSVDKLRWDAPNEALLQSVAHIDPSILTATWPSDPLLDIPQTMPWAGITTQSVQGPALPPSHPTHPEASLEQMLPELYHYFFKYVYNSMPIISEARFLSELSTNPTSKSISALKYSIALLSAAISSQYQHLRQDLYSLVRRQIEDCEMDPDTTVFSNLNVFQTLLFMVRYEIMSSNITRAWMTLGRAIRLSSVLRLHMIDRSEKPDDAVPGLHVSLPATDDECLLEERRRSFWLLFVWETYIKTRTAMESHLGPISSFHVKLPSPGRLGPKFSPVDMPFLIDAERLITGVSPFCACLLMVDLAMKCLNKIEYSNEGHTALERCFRERVLLMQEIFEDQTLSQDPIALTTKLNMSAIIIILYDKAPKSQEAPELVMKRISLHQDSAKCIADILKASWETRMMEGSPFTLQATFLAWPLATAINTLAEALQPSMSWNKMKATGIHSHKTLGKN
ncbi:major facilitator superfamily domain, general substrate transporter [Fusarium flagelliforme]|uniref:Major facilitator superfamily domain, general substrate transporter n=1 Tax=Fusarium flagelliforme TaxID=2675880 RepID=A0A395N3T3_9HYPO|nr:major facilitator superfamily domain, general substrate transporter [Fusarium flagelliforme]